MSEGAPTPEEGTAETDLQSENEFSPDGIRAWTADLSKATAAKALVLLIAKLETLSRSEVLVLQRINALRELKRPAAKLVTGLLKRKPEGVPGRDESKSGLLFVQRIYRLMCINLKLALAELDRSELALDRAFAPHRSWLAENLYRYLSRQILLALESSVSCPEGTWLDLHDLYSCIMRHQAALTLEGEPLLTYDFDTETEYKRLLLLGLVAESAPETRRKDLSLDRFPEWAWRSRLRDPASCIGEYDPVRVEIIRDLPPRFHSGSLAEGFRGWVLVPPDDYLAWFGLDAAGRDDNSGFVAR